MAQLDTSGSFETSVNKEKSSAKKVVDQFLETPYGQKIEQAAVSGYAKSRNLINLLDQGVRSNPWPVVAGAAVGSLALGFLLAKLITFDSSEAEA